MCLLYITRTRLNSSIGQKLSSESKFVQQLLLNWRIRLMHQCGLLLKRKSFLPPTYNGGRKSQSVLRFFPNSAKSPRSPSIPLDYFRYLTISVTCPCNSVIYFLRYDSSVGSAFANQSVGCWFESRIRPIFLTRRKLSLCLACALLLIMGDLDGKKSEYMLYKNKRRLEPYPVD